MRFTSSSATVDGERLTVRGQLEAAGEQVPVELDATLRVVDDELEVEAVTARRSAPAGHDLEPARDGARAQRSWSSARA